jgi:hypothetical protein
LQTPGQPRAASLHCQLPPTLLHLALTIACPKLVCRCSEPDSPWGKIFHYSFGS